ncbi:MAG: 50S ribosomal protein L21 [Oscillospiraceae bacterium]|jgi:large subunit ribosomal protein L21|nr:50S ribosomal protein L21 [Oscillospiraceae bacterium]
MYAVISLAGKQYRVAPGDVFYSERVGVSEGECVELTPLAFYDDSTLLVDSEKLSSLKVSLSVLGHIKAKKITVFTYKPKKSCKRKIGHRQLKSKLKVVSMS